MAGAQILAYQMTIQYDAAALALQQVDRPANAQNGWELVHNEVEPGRILLVGYSATPLENDGPLVELTFQATGQKGQQGVVAIESVRWNEESERALGNVTGTISIGTASGSDRQRQMFLPIISR